MRADLHTSCAIMCLVRAAPQCARSKGAGRARGNLLLLTTHCPAPARVCACITLSLPSATASAAPAGLIPRATAALSTLEFSQRQLRRTNGGVLSPGAAYLSGALSGVSEGVAFAPFQVIKVVRQEGVLALATGLGPTLWRNCVWNSLYYGTMHQLEDSRDGLGLLPVIENPVLAAARCATAVRNVGWKV
ncbi:hypothetical protein Vretifemale_4358 [Volvox reticuliferus]|uniref:Uncharacterized protein n=1 Tax=Volvox reticuliferus TaxID=1737510 RepID=A0A8J4C9I3_9CHLO|nr:hypothetical protein Vretifemale_4358 [Volvox reticuliferus]